MILFFDCSSHKFFSLVTGFAPLRVKPLALQKALPHGRRATPVWLWWRPYCPLLSPQRGLGLYFTSSSYFLVRRMVACGLHER